MTELEACLLSDEIIAQPNNADILRIFSVMLL